MALSVVETSLAKRDGLLEWASECGEIEACDVFEGSKRVWERVDTKSDLESRTYFYIMIVSVGYLTVSNFIDHITVGRCSIPLPLSIPARRNPGIDYTALLSISHVECIERRCAFRRCKDGYVIDVDWLEVLGRGILVV